jgi:hypothetical protein
VRKDSYSKKSNPDKCKELLEGLDYEEKGIWKVLTLVLTKVGGYVQALF